MFSNETADNILALQLVIAWAGEGRCEPPRLGWWQTDVTDEAGGGDFLRRLLPQTYSWAGLEAAREAARRVDANARKQLSAHEKLRSLFFWGFEADEQISDRLLTHKRSKMPPSKALSLPIDLSKPFHRDDLAKALQPAKPIPYQDVPRGRQLTGPIPGSPAEAARHLVAAMFPLSKEYPLPFYRL